MNRYKFLPACEKEIKRLLKKYTTVEDDLRNLTPILDACPLGVGKNFTILHAGKNVTIVKVRMACRSLQERSLRLIYAFHERENSIVFIELYYKGNKENEDRRRIEEYVKHMDQ